MCMWWWRCLFTSVQRPEGEFRYLVTGIRVGCESPNMDPGHQKQVLFESSMLS